MVREASHLLELFGILSGETLQSQCFRYDQGRFCGDLSEHQIFLHDLMPKIVSYDFGGLTDEDLYAMLRSIFGSDK